MAQNHKQGKKNRKFGRNKRRYPAYAGPSKAPKSKGSNRPEPKFVRIEISADHRLRLRDLVFDKNTRRVRPVMGFDS